MPTLNRFPLLGLWAREAALRVGYRKSEADALGHAYAVLYAIRANKVKKSTTEEKGQKPKPARDYEQMNFAGDDIDVIYDDRGRVQGFVGHEHPQTASSFRFSIARKFPEGYFEKLSEAFRKVMKTFPPRQLNSRRVYDVYDQWKKQCGVGRLVDLDKLLAWCQVRARQVTADSRARSSRRSRASAKAAPSKSLLK
jgi:hypothetical protein